MIHQLKKNKISPNNYSAITRPDFDTMISEALSYAVEARKTRNSSVDERGERYGEIPITA